MKAVSERSIKVLLVRLIVHLICVAIYHFFAKAYQCKEIHYHLIN